MFGFRKKTHHRIAEVYAKLPKSFAENWQIAVENHAVDALTQLQKMLFLINGGALVAILAYLGSLARYSLAPPQEVSTLIYYFGAGLSATVIGSVFLSIGLNTLTSAFLDAWVKRNFVPLYKIGNLLAALGLLGFILSSGFAVAGFSKAPEVFMNAPTAIVTNSPAEVPSSDDE